MTTDARIRACADILNQASYAALNKVWVERNKTNPLLIGNFDGTSFQILGGGSGNVLSYSIKKEEVKDIGAPHCGLTVAPKSTDRSITDYFIKYILIITAHGMQSEPIYMLADENMAEDEVRHYRVQGLGIGTQVNRLGHLIITRTRCANKSFYKWLLTDILIPFVEDIRKEYELRTRIRMQLT